MSHKTKSWHIYIEFRIYDVSNIGISLQIKNPWFTCFDRNGVLDFNFQNNLQELCMV